MTVRYVHELLDERSAATPDAQALVADGLGWTYGQLEAHSHRLAAWLRAEDVSRGDRVLIAAPHSPWTVALLFAVSRVGGIYVVVSDRIKPYHLEHILADSEPQLILVPRGVVGLVPGDDDRLRAIEDLQDLQDLGGLEYLEPSLQADGSLSRASTDVVSLIYTSGSTAMPKAVVSTHDQVVFAATAIQDRLSYRGDDRVLCCLPLSFDYGLYQVFLCAASGACLVLTDSSAAGPALVQVLETHAITVMPLVPALASALARLARRTGGLPQALRLVTNTGAALSPAASAALREWSPDLSVVAMYGLTECKRVSIEEPNADAVRPGSIGRALPGTEVLVLDEDGEPLPPGQVGQLAVRGQHVMAGYWRAPELTTRRFPRDGFGRATLLTGDRGWADKEGYLYFAGRDDDVYKQGGFRVSAVEIEAAAADVAGVEEAVVLPPTDRRPAVLAVVTALDATTVRHELGRRLEDFKVPEDIRVLERLPHGINGKIDKRELEAGL